MKETRIALGRKPNAPIHFYKLTHPQKLAWAQIISKHTPARTISVIVHKPSIKSPEVFKCQPYHLYRYCSRILIERISWFCRDNLNAGDGDGTAEMFFSNRRTMSYQAIKDYWLKIKGQNEADCRIDWRYIDPSKIYPINHDQMAGLQIVDAVASSTGNAVSLDKFGNSEPRYFLELKKLIYKRQNDRFGYGLKFWPKFEDLRPSIAHLSAFDGL
jgi:hypothetical protein